MKNTGSGADKLLETSRYIDSQIASVRENIARAEGELSRIETLEEEHKTFSAQVSELSKSLEIFTETIKSKSEIVMAFAEMEKTVNEINTALEKLKSEAARAEFVQNQKETEKKSALEAQEKLKTVERWL